MPAFSQTTKKEIDVAFAPMDSIRPVLEQSLSPTGKFVMLPSKGSVMVIDTPAGIQNAEIALASAALPVPNVALSVGMQPGLPPKRTQIQIGREVMFPVEYEAPQIITNFQGPGGPFAVVPATPTKFVKRNIGYTSDTTTTVNPDGSITMDINSEHTEFEGFINYGSAILPAGGLGNIPISDQATNPAFFNPFLNSGDIKMPIISTTRIQTSIIIRPRVLKGVVSVDMMPQLRVESTEPDADDLVVNLKQYQTTLDVKNNAVGRIRGFTNASDEFNKEFLEVEKQKRGKGEVGIIVKAKIQPASANTEVKETKESAQ